MNDILEIKVAILMATYNGALYIEEQIRSILQQTYSKFDLIIRDDGSTDNTMEIIKAIDDERIYVLSDDKKNKGALNNFRLLFEFAKQKYDIILFSDQDDVWLNDKVEQTVKKLSVDIPKLVYGNFNLWYSDIGIKEKMFNDDLSISFESTLVQNPIYGCTMGINKGMIEMVETIPFFCENHDYWIALVALYNDTRCVVEYNNNVLLDHRLHEKNVTGNKNSRSLWGRMKSIVSGPLRKDVRNEKKKFWWKISEELISRYGVNKHADNLRWFNSYEGIRYSIGFLKRGFRGLSKKATLYFLLMKR